MIRRVVSVVGTLLSCSIAIFCLVSMCCTSIVNRQINDDIIKVAKLCASINSDRIYRLDREGEKIIGEYRNGEIDYDRALGKLHSIHKADDEIKRIVSNIYENEYNERENGLCWLRIDSALHSSRDRDYDKVASDIKTIIRGIESIEDDLKSMSASVADYINRDEYNSLIARLRELTNE